MSGYTKTIHLLLNKGFQSTKQKYLKLNFLKYNTGFVAFCTVKYKFL